MCFFKLQRGRALVFLAVFSLAFSGPAWSQQTANDLDILRGQIEALQEKVSELEGFREELDTLRGRLQELQAKDASTPPVETAAREKSRFVETINKLNVSGGITGVLQGSFGVDDADGANSQFAAASVDLIFEAPISSHGFFLLDLEAIGGDGPDSDLSTLSTLNFDAGSTNARVEVWNAFLEQSFYNDLFTASVGKIRLIDYFDTNAVAASEDSQFISGSLRSSAVLGSAPRGAGATFRVALAPTEWLTLQAAGRAQDTDGDGNETDDLFDHPYGIGEVDLTFSPFGLEGNYRFYATVDDLVRNASADRDGGGLGFGVSLDQQVTDYITLFGRYGRRDRDKTGFTTYQAWSAGGQVEGLIPQRPEDIFAFGWSEVWRNRRTLPANSPLTATEKLGEVYYRYVLNDRLAVTAFTQMVFDRNGDPNQDAIVFPGVRARVDF
jgi:hypothetical protein